MMVQNEDPNLLAASIKQDYQMFVRAAKQEQDQWKRHVAECAARVQILRMKLLFRKFGGELSNEDVIEFLTL